MPDAPRTRQPTSRPQEEAAEAPLADVAPWAPPPAVDEALPGREAVAGPPAGHEAPVELLPDLEAEAFEAEAPTPPPAVQEAWRGPPPGESAREPLAWPWPESGAEAGGTLLPGRPTPPLDLPLPVLVLTEQARRVPEAERPELASRLNALLEEMAQGGGDRQVADTFHRLLEGGKLEGLVDAQGRSCRAMAVEALLSMGFPYALEVRPEDLEHHRTAMRGGGKLFRYGPGVPMSVLGAGLAGQALQALLEHSAPEGLLTVQVGLSLLSAMALWLAPPGTPVYRVALGLLAAVSGFALVLSLVPGLPVGLWAALAGLVAVFLAALRES